MWIEFQLEPLNTNRDKGAYLQSVRLDIPARVVIGTLGISPFMVSSSTKRQLIKITK